MNFFSICIGLLTGIIFMAICFYIANNEKVNEYFNDARQGKLVPCYKCENLIEVEEKTSSFRYQCSACRDSISGETNRCSDVRGCRQCIKSAKEKNGQDEN